MIPHIGGFEDLPNQFEKTDDFADGSTLLMTIGNSRVLSAGIVQTQKVGIVCEDDPSLR